MKGANKRKPPSKSLCTYIYIYIVLCRGRTALRGPNTRPKSTRHIGCAFGMMVWFLLVLRAPNRFNRQIDAIDKSMQHED